MSLRRLAVGFVTATALAAPATATATGTGILDRPFGTDGVSVARNTPGWSDGLVDQVYDAVLTRSGRTIVLGEDSRLHALTPAGRLDRRWGRNGLLDPEMGDRNQREALSLVARSDGGVYVIGIDVRGGPAVARVDPRGHLVRSFGDDGTARSGTGDYAFPIQTRAPVGPAVLSATVGSQRLVVAAFSAETGSPVSWFGRDGRLEIAADLPGGPSVLRLARDGRFTLLTPMSGRNVPVGLDVRRFGGDGAVTREVLPFAAYRVIDDGSGFVALTDGPLVHLRDDGTPTGTSALPPAMTSVRAALRTPDGALLLAGTGRRANGENRLALARLTPSGKPDPAFWPGGVRLLSFPRARIGQRLGALVGPAGPGGLVTALGTSGDGYNDVREDLGPTYLAALRVRTRRPVVSVVTTSARVDRRGRARVTLRCRAGRSICPRPTLTVRHGGRRLSRRSAPRARPGTTRVSFLALGERGRRIALRRGSVEIEVAAGGDRVRTTVRLRRA